MTPKIKMEEQGTELSYAEQIKISTAISSDLCKEDVLRFIVPVTTNVMGSKIYSLYHLDGCNKTFSPKATQSMNEGYLKARVFR